MTAREQTMDAAIDEGNWEKRLADALPSANLPTLLMVLVHLTGDQRWLSDHYRCARSPGLEPLDSGGLDESRRSEILAAAHEAILAWRRGTPPRYPAPDAETLTRMTRLSTGERVPDGYGDIVAAGLGLDPSFELDQRKAFDVPQDFKVVIIGAGVAGLCAAIRL